MELSLEAEMGLRGFCVLGEIIFLNASGEKWVEGEILLIQEREQKNRKRLKGNNCRRIVFKQLTTKVSREERGWVELETSITRERQHLKAGMLIDSCGDGSLWKFSLMAVDFMCSWSNQHSFIGKFSFWPLLGYHLVCGILSYQDAGPVTDFYLFGIYCAVQVLIIIQNPGIFTALLSTSGALTGIRYFHILQVSF